MVRACRSGKLHELVERCYAKVEECKAEMAHDNGAKPAPEAEGAAPSIARVSVISHRSRSLLLQAADHTGGVNRHDGVTERGQLPRMRFLPQQYMPWSSLDVLPQVRQTYTSALPEVAL